MPKMLSLDNISQIAIPALTVGSYILTSLKHPEWGLLLAFASQPFWLYSSYKSYKQAGQSGIFLNTVVMTFVILFGIINYWLL
jgi:hypothetical protein